MERSSEDICMICLKEKATQKNSHCIPAGLLAPAIGGRDREESHRFDFASGTIDTYYGRSNQKNNEHQIVTEQKEPHYALDYIFCPGCESKLGQLESKVLPALMIDLRNNPNSYHIKQQANGITYRELKKVHHADFLIFIFSLIFRYDIYIRFDHGVNYLKTEEYDKLRHIIFEYIYSQKIDESIGDANGFKFNLLTKDKFKDDEATHVFTLVEQDNPNIIFFSQFIVFWYSDTDTIVPGNPLLEFNNIDIKRSAIIISEDLWMLFMRKMADVVIPDFAYKVGRQYSEINGKSIEENKDEFLRLVATIKLTPEQEKTTSHVQEALKIMANKYS